MESVICSVEQALEGFALGNRLFKDCRRFRIYKYIGAGCQVRQSLPDCLSDSHSSTLLEHGKPRRALRYCDNHLSRFYSRDSARDAH